MKFILSFYSLILLSINLDVSMESMLSNDKIGSPEVKTPLGRLQGKYLESRDGKIYSAFLGIPYAEPPNRFKAPKPVKSWENLRDATKYGEICFQKHFKLNISIGGEDCLYLNVYTPDVNGNLPVMVSIHGGSFLFGSGDQYGEKYYMDENVVLVSINYRLGSFGFLSTGDGVISGNFGLKDQAMSLRWVQENIKSFGGDKERVTIFGISAGASSVSYHIVSPKSKGLFNKAISQSGSALNPWAHVKNPMVAATEMANKLGCPTDDSQKLANCLKKKTLPEIMKGQDLAKWSDYSPIAPFAPVTETYSMDAFLTECPFKILNEGRFNKVPWIATIVKDEGQSLHAAQVIFHDHLRKDINENWQKVAPLTFEYEGLNLSDENKNSISAEIRQFYLNNNKIEESTRQNLSYAYSDRLFIHGIQMAALMQAKHSPVYTGIFAFKGVPGILSLFGLEDNEDIVTHGDDIKFYHNFPGMDENVKGSGQEKASKMLVKLWVTFASSSLPELKVNGLTWSKVSSDEIEKKSLKWLILDEEPKILSENFDKRMKFWDYILLKYQPISYLSSKQEL